MSKSLSFLYRYDRSIMNILDFLKHMNHYNDLKVIEIIQTVYGEPSSFWKLSPPKTISTLERLQDNIWRKTFVNTKTNKKHQEYFQQEINFLQDLKDCPFVPTLLFVDVPNSRYYTTDCGSLLSPSNNISKTQSEQLVKNIKELEYTWGITKSINNNNGNNNNTLNDLVLSVKDNKIFIIDFTQPIWKKTMPKSPIQQLIKNFVPGIIYTS